MTQALDSNPADSQAPVDSVEEPVSQTKTRAGTALHETSRSQESRRITWQEARRQRRHQALTWHDEELVPPSDSAA